MSCRILIGLKLFIFSVNGMGVFGFVKYVSVFLPDAA